VLYLRFRTELARPLRTDVEPRRLGEPLVVATSACATAAALAGFAVWPHDLGTVALIAGGGAALVLLASRRWTPPRAVRAAGPGLLLFALGVFAMVDAAERHGLRAFVLRHDPASATGLGVVAGALSNVVNNLPATAITLPLAGADAGRAHALLAGVDAGPNLTLAGSLATLLWLAAARSQGVDVRPLRYIAIGVLTAPVGLAAALGVLALLG
jgi:arsenical pump membrane protein